MSENSEKSEGLHENNLQSWKKCILQNGELIDSLETLPSAEVSGILFLQLSLA